MTPLLQCTFFNLSKKANRCSSYSFFGNLSCCVIHDSPKTFYGCRRNFDWAIISNYRKLMFVAYPRWRNSRELE